MNASDAPAATPGRDPSAHALLALCAIAREPLSIADIRQLAGDHFPSDESVRSAVIRSDGLIAGGGAAASGYAFADPSCRDHFLEHALAPDRHREWLGRFIEWGERSYRGRDVPPYLRRHWIAHLIQAGMDSQAIAVVSRFDRTPEQAEGPGRIQRWHSVRFGAERLDFGYHSDLELARVAHGSEGSPGKLLRLGLIAASLRSRLDNIIPELLEGLIRTGTPQGRWTGEMALGTIRASGPRRRGPLLAAALRAGITPRPDELLGLLTSIPWSDRFAAEALGEVLQHLPAADLLAAAELAESIADRDDRVSLLSALIPRIPPGQRDRPLEVLLRDGREADSYPIWRLVAPVLAEFFPADRLEEFAGDSRLWDQIPFHLDVISHLIRRGPRSIRNRTLEASKQHAPYLRIDVLAALVADLPHDERLRAFSEVLDRIAPGNFGWIALAREVPDELLERAYEQFRSLPGASNSNSISALLIFSRRFPEPKRSALYRAAWEGYMAASKEQPQRGTRRTLYESAPDSCIDDLARSMLSIADPTERFESAAELIPHLPPGRREGVAAEAWRCYRDNPPRAASPSNLMVILGSVPADLFPSACDEALAAFKGPDRSRILAGIIHRFPADQQPARWGRCLDDCRSIGNVAERAKALAFLVGRVPADSELAFVAKVATALEAVDDPADRSEALLMLAGWAPEAQRIEFFARALEEASVPRERFRPRPHHPLINLCEEAPEPLLGRVLQAVRDQEDPSDRAELMLALAPRLPEPDRDALLAEALEAAFAPRRRGVVPHLASRLFGVLPEPSFERAWELIRAMEDPRKQATVFEAFLPHLPDSLLDRVRNDLPGLQHRQYRTWGEIQVAERRLGREAARELSWARELDIQINSPFRLRALVQSTWASRKAIRPDSSRTRWSRSPRSSSRSAARSH